MQERRSEGGKKVGIRWRHVRRRLESPLLLLPHHLFMRTGILCRGEKEGDLAAVALGGKRERGKASGGGCENLFYDSSRLRLPAVGKGGWRRRLPHAPARPPGSSDDARPFFPSQKKRRWRLQQHALPLRPFPAQLSRRKKRGLKK